MVIHMLQNNKSKIEKYIQENDGIFTRSDALKIGISSSSFAKYIHENEMLKVSAGIYAPYTSTIDEFSLLQKRYPKIIYSGMSALYLHRLTDKIIEDIEFTVPKGYRIRKETINQPFVFHIENNLNLFEIGNTYIQTMFGNKVLCYGAEKQIVEMIRKRNNYDSETFIKAIKTFLRRQDKNMTFLFEYAAMRKVENKVFETLELLNYEN